MKIMPSNFDPAQPCPFGCQFYCPCPDGCNGCDAKFTDLKLLGDCRMPESDDCCLNKQRRFRAYESAGDELFPDHKLDDGAVPLEHSDERPGTCEGMLPDKRGEWVSITHVHNLLVGEQQWEKDFWNASDEAF